MIAAAPSDAEANHALAVRARDGDATAREELIVRNHRLAIHCSRPWWGVLGADDAIAEADAAIVRSADGFDPGLGLAFSGYARRAIRTACCDAADRRHPILGLGSARELRRVAAGAQAEAPRHALARRVLESAVVEIEPAHHGREDDPAAALVLAEDVERVRRAVARLPARERAIVALRFGLDGSDPMDFGRIGGRVGLSGERARRLAIRALGRLAEALGGP